MSWLLTFAITHAGRKNYASTARPTFHFSPEMGVTGFHSLEFTAAARFEAFLKTILMSLFQSSACAGSRSMIFNYSSDWGEVSAAIAL